MPPPLGRSRRIGVLGLAAATFFIVSGGPYGLEEILQAHGYGRAVALLLFLPLVWCLPVAFLVGELGSALPCTGGYYEWVRRGLGEFWGLQEAWLSLAYSVVDLAIYPTLLVAYAGQVLPALAAGTQGWAGWWLGMGMIAGCTLWNALGIRAVGLGSEALGVAVLGPFVVMVALAAAALPGGGLARLGAALAAPPPEPGTGATWAAGLLLALWNYMGWDNASTFSGEVEDAPRAYPRAMLVVVGLVAAAYVLPVLAAASAGLPAASFGAGSWVAAGRALGGAPLAGLVMLGGGITVVGMFNAILLAWSRLPVALAEDGYLPRLLAWRSPGSGAPVPALVAGGGLVALLVGLELTRLVAIDVMLQGMALLLEFAALVALRLREPGLPRPFRVPGGLAGALLLGVPPAGLLAFSAWRGRGEPGALGVRAVPLALLVAAIGPAWWALSRRRRARAAARVPGAPADP
ncbi:MAG TPA: APC family permease [Anaeromyxobacter sp.]|nr:APC family permease [Anaeromyxobacter sp.]